MLRWYGWAGVTSQSLLTPSVASLPSSCHWLPVPCPFCSAVRHPLKLAGVRMWLPTWRTFFPTYLTSAKDFPAQLAGKNCVSAVLLLYCILPLLWLLGILQLGKILTYCYWKSHISKHTSSAEKICPSTSDSDMAVSPHDAAHIIL